MKANTMILSLVMSVIMLVACTVTVCSAENNIEDLPEGNFTFVPTDPRERINSDGSFTFYFRHSLTSGKFTANSNTVRIDTGARVYDLATDSYYDDSNALFTVSLYKSNGVRVGRYLASADNAYGGISYPVTKGSTYYLYFEIQSDFTGTGKYISGWGKISPVTPK